MVWNIEDALQDEIVRGSFRGPIPFSLLMESASRSGVSMTMSHWWIYHFAG